MCGSASWWAKLALVCILLALMLHVGGFASDNWMTYESKALDTEVDVGLWEQKNCTAGKCNTSSVDGEYETDEFNAVRGLETVVLCLVLLLTILLLIYVCVDTARVFKFAMAIVVLCFIAGLASLVATFLWVAEVPSPFIISYSMGLTVLACVLVLLAGTLLIPELVDSEDQYLVSTRAVTPYSARDRGSIITLPSTRDRGAAALPASTRGLSGMANPYASPYALQDRNSVITPMSYRSKGFRDSYQW